MKLSFRPLSGNLLSLQKVRKEHDTEVLFSSPIGESTFSTKKRFYTRCKADDFRPLSGNLLSLPGVPNTKENNQSGFRPLSGNLLSLQIMNKAKMKLMKVFSSPIGESTFSTETSGMCYLLAMLFSSPIGESTFSTKINIHRGDSWNVFVPYRGIYFLY